MSSLLYRLGRFAVRRRRLVIAAWVLILVASAAAALTLMKPFASHNDIPGTESQRSLDVLRDRFPTADGAEGRIVFHTSNGERIDAGPARAAVLAATEQAAAVRGVAAAEAPYPAGAVSADRGTAITALTFAAKRPEDVPASVRDAVAEVAERARGAGLTVELGGEAFVEETAPFGVAELAGLFVTLGVLVFVFRSLRAAVVPLVTALVGVAVGVLLVLAGGHFVTMDSSSLTLALMLGLAVGVDYALFIVSRHRDQVRAGMEPAESVGRAVGTAGTAVVFAGATVVIALAALAVVRIPFLTVMGVAAAVTVVVSVLVALTLLPALLGVLGARVASSAIPALRRAADRADGAGRAGGRAAPGARWVGVVIRSRWVVLPLGVAGLALCALPALDLRPGLPKDRGDTTAVRAQRLIDAGFGPGYTGALVVVVQGSPASAMPAAEMLAAKVATLADVASVAKPVPDASGGTVMVHVVPAAGPDSTRTRDLLDDIRHARDPIAGGTRTRIDVTGGTAVDLDVASRLAAALPVYCLVVMGLAVLLLTVVFRSAVVPVKAALGFLLSALGALGAVVAVFQWGWSSALVGLDGTGPIVSFLPILLIGILFGLAMDYEVFLVSRMREEYTRGRPALDALRVGYGHSAKVVTAAALIMVSVFGSFVLSDNVVVKGMGFALAAGVLFDAFVVRMTLVPAVLAVLGDRAWWLPRALDRLLPDVDLEGAGPTRRLDGAAAVPPERVNTC
ncbi:MMPL family transporter [Embleya hyalina]|uniref:Membrane protein n=1 Tax=Embleya hyalina TaxID=516124 RepID=A0A401YZX9_9ACTN|nr:MMPL family transporter [Embleya hyalina]GCE00190.1 membrane protein [Embleya hyalina]